MIISNSASMPLACQSSMSQENSASSNCPLFGAPPLELTLRPVGERYPLTELEFSVTDILRWGYVNFGFEGTVNKIFGLAKNYFGFSKPPLETSTEPVSVPMPKTCASTLGYTIFAESRIVPSGSKIFLSPTLARSRTTLESGWEKNAGGTYWKYVSTRQEGWDGFHSDEFHSFTFKESFSLDNGIANENLLMEMKRKYPAIFYTAPIKELLDNAKWSILRHLGFQYFPWNDTFYVPSLTTLIRKWDELRLNHPSLPGLYIVLCEGTEENDIFVSSVLDGAIPISITTEYEHDITTHLMPTIQLMSHLINVEGKTDQNENKLRALTKYQNTKQTISSTLSYLFELIKEPQGKQLLFTSFDRYLKDYPFSDIETTLDVKETFYEFCHTMVGILLDMNSAYEDLENYAGFIQTLNEEPENIFTKLFPGGWDLFFEKRYGKENTVFFKGLFVSALLPMIQMRKEMENHDRKE